MDGWMDVQHHVIYVAIPLTYMIHKVVAFAFIQRNLFKRNRPQKRPWCNSKCCSTLEKTTKGRECSSVSTN